MSSENRAAAALSRTYPGGREAFVVAMNAKATALGQGFELTVFAVQDRRPSRAQEEQIFSSGWSFRVYCCSRAFP